jgi:surfeit locus 1 family protein
MRPKTGPKLRIDRRDLVGLVVALLVAAACVRLGVWQLDRLHQRRERNAVLLAARARPLLEVTGSLPADSARDRRLHARGVYDYARERLWRARSYQGVPGVDLVTPLRLADGAAVLVDRGWAPSPDAYHLDQPAYWEGDSAVVLGLGMLAPRARGDVDPAALRDSVPYPLLPFVIQQLPPAAAASRPLPAGLIRWPSPELSDGPHLSYAIQWFSFAVIIVVGSVALARKRAAEAELELQGRGRGTINALS